jgi:hypothetical protein
MQSDAFAPRRLRFFANVCDYFLQSSQVLFIREEQQCNCVWELPGADAANIGVPGSRASAKVSFQKADRQLSAHPHSAQALTSMFIVYA